MQSTLASTTSIESVKAWSFVDHLSQTALQLKLLAIAVGEQDVSLTGSQGLELLPCHDFSSQVRELCFHLPLSLHGLSVLLQVELQGLNIVVKAESGHRRKNVFAI